MLLARLLKSGLTHCSMVWRITEDSARVVKEICGTVDSMPTRDGSVKKCWEKWFSRTRIFQQLKVIIKAIQKTAPWKRGIMRTILHHEVTSMQGLQT